MAEDRDVIPYGNRSNQEDLSFQIEGGAPKALDDNSVGGLSVNPLGAFGNRSKNSSNGFEKEFDIGGLPRRPAIDSIDDSFDDGLFFGSRLDAPSFISPVNKSTKKRSQLQNTQYPTMQPQFASNVAGANNLYPFNQLPAAEGGYIKPLLEPQPVLTEQEIQQQSSQQAQLKQFHKSHDLNCGCGPSFKCALHQAPKRAGGSKNYDQFAINDNQDYRTKLLSNVHQYNPMIPYNLNAQGQNVMGQQRYTQEQIQQQAQQAQSRVYSQGKRDRVKHGTSSRTALQTTSINPQYQNPGQAELLQSQLQQTQYNLAQQQVQQQQVLQQQQRRLQHAQNQPQAWQQQQLLQEAQPTRRQKELEIMPNISTTAHMGGMKAKVVTTEQPQAKAHISIPTQLLTGIEGGSQQAHDQQRFPYQQPPADIKQEPRAENQAQGIPKNSPTGKGTPRKQVISIDFASKPTKPAPGAKTGIKVQEIPVYQPLEKPRAATIVIPRMEPQVPVPVEREQSQAKPSKPEPKAQIDSQIVSKNFSNNADSQVSSIQNSYDDGMSADSNKADLGNKQKVEFTQDNTSQQVVKATPNINTEQKLTMTINDRSMASSRLQENLMVSIALGNRGQKAKNQATGAAAEKRKDQTDSFNNQSFAGKSKNSRLVTIPIGDANREASGLMGSVEQSKEAPKRQKVSISFNQSDKKPTAKAEIIIPAPPPPAAAPIQVPLDPTRQLSTNNVPSQDGGSVLKQILMNQITNKSTFLPQSVGDQYKHLHKQEVQSTTTTKLNVSVPVTQPNTQLNDINTLQNLLPSMIYQQAQSQIPQNLMAAQLPGAKTPPKHQPVGDWLKQRPEQTMKYQSIQSHNSNFANYKIEQGQNAAYFDKPGAQRRNKFNLGNQQQNQSASQTRSTKAKEHQAQQDHSMRPPDREQFQMNNQLPGSQKFSDLAKQISYDLSSEFRDNQSINVNNMTLQNDVRLRWATAAAQAAKLTTGQQQQLKFPQHHQEQSQTQNAQNNNGNRSRADAQSAGPRPQNSGSMTARQGSTPNNQVLANDARAGGNYDASSHHNISIGNFIRQDVIVNIHMGNMAIANPGAKDTRPQQPHAEAEAARLSQVRSGKAHSGQNAHAQQQELGQAIVRQMESSASRDPQRDPQNSGSAPLSAEARSTVAIASEHLHHEMTMSIASSKHLNFTAKIEPPVMAAPIEEQQKDVIVSKSIPSLESSPPASSMQAQPGSSNSNSQQTEAALTLISTFQQLIQGQAHQGQELKLPRGQAPLQQMNFDNAAPSAPRMDGAPVQNAEEQQDACEPRQPADHAFLSKVQDSLQQLHRIEQTEHIEKLITLTRGLQANQQQGSPPDSQKPLAAPKVELPDQVPVQQVTPDRAPIEQPAPAQSAERSEERKSEEVQPVPQAERPKGRAAGRGRSNTRGGGRGAGRGGGRGRGARGAAAARNKVEEAPKVEVSQEREMLEDVIPKHEPVEQLKQVQPEAELEEMQHQADPDPTSQSANVCDISTLLRQKLQKLTTKSDNPVQPDNFNKAEEWPHKPQSEAELNNSQQKIDTNNLEMMHDLQNISQICDIKVLEEINLVKQAMITNAPAHDQDTNVQQIQRNNQTLEDQVQELFANFQANLKHIHDLHEQINAAVGQGQQAEVDGQDLQPSQRRSPAPDQVPQGHDTLRLMQAQIENIQKIAKETQKFHEFFQHANMAPPLPGNPTPLSKGQQAQEDIIPLQNEDLSPDIEKSSNGNWREAAPEGAEEKLEELQARDQSLKQKRQIIEQQLESIYNQQRHSNSHEREDERPKEQDKRSEARRFNQDQTNLTLVASEAERESRSMPAELEKVQSKNKQSSQQKKIFQVSGEKAEKQKQRKTRKKKTDIEQEKAALNSNEAVIGERNANISSTPPRMELSHQEQAGASAPNEDAICQVHIVPGLPIQRLGQVDAGQSDRRLPAQGTKNLMKAAGQWQSSQNLSSISSDLKGMSMYQPAVRPRRRRGREASQASAKPNSEEPPELRIQAKEPTTQPQAEARSPKPIFICTKVRPSIAADAQKGPQETEPVLRKRTRQQTAQKHDQSEKADIDADKSDRSGVQTRQVGNDHRLGPTLQNENDIQNAKRRITISLDFEKNEESTSNKRLLKIEEKNKEQSEKNQARISLILPPTTQTKQAENNSDAVAVTQLAPPSGVPLVMPTMPPTLKVPLRVVDKKSCVLSIDLKGPKTVAAVDRAQRGQQSFALAADPANFQLWKGAAGNEQSQSLLDQIAGISNAKKPTPIIDQNDAADKRQSWPSKPEADALKPDAAIALSDASEPKRAGQRGQEAKMETKQAKNTNYLLKELQSLRPDAEELLRIQGTGQPTGQDNYKRPQRNRKCKQKAAVEPEQPKVAPNEQEGPSPAPTSKKAKAGRKASPKSGKKSTKQQAEQEAEAQKTSDTKLPTSGKAPAASAAAQSSKEPKAQTPAPATAATAHVDWELLGPAATGTRNKRAAKQAEKQEQKATEDKRDVDASRQELVGQLGSAGANSSVPASKPSKRARHASKEGTQLQEQPENASVSPKGSKTTTRNTSAPNQDLDKKSQPVEAASKGLPKGPATAPATTPLRNNLRATTQRHLFNSLQSSGQTGGLESGGGDFQTGGGPQGQYNLVQCDAYPSFETQPYRIYFTFEVQMLMYIHSYLSKNEVIGLLGGKSYDSNVCIKGTNEPIRYLIVSKIYPSESCIKTPSVRLKNCEISDDQQIKIQEQMDKDGVVKLAWYHSHPIFEVDPSVLDLQTHQRQQSCFDSQGLPFFGVIIGPYHAKQGISETLFKVFHLKEDKSQNKQRTVKLNFKDRGRALQHKIIPNTKLKYSMYQDIKQMIRQGSTHKYDRPDLAQEWGTRRNKTRYTNQEKFMRSLEKVCDENLKLQSEFDVVREIRDQLKRKEDCIQLDAQLYKTHEPPLTIMLQQSEAKKAKGDQDQAAGNGEPLAAPTQDAGQYQLPQEAGGLPASQAAHLQQNLQSRTFFSISESKKISKYLFKIEQCLIKNFGVKTQNLMEQTYKTLQQQENLDNQEKQSANDNSKEEY